MVMGTFPFGEPVQALERVDREPKEIFILGVYASAVHARWRGPDGKELIKALAVASEPYIFWRGEGTQSIVDRIKLPPGAGQLEPASAVFNGPSGLALDRLYLLPLARARSQAWLSDLVPHSCVNGQQQAAIDRSYRPRMARLGLPVPSVPSVPLQLANQARQEAIAAELVESRARILVLLGDKPIQWFSSRWLPKYRRLADFGTDADRYGRLVETTVADARVALLPLAHPRQVARLGKSSDRWYELHQNWLSQRAPTLI